ncbi:hypothetical protein L3X38_026712 [Prunus dulcis]|uniref:Reverse transcriptase RNase H-like domain-containing protein n=1 Tax=Prunus dulcis TaxID=3755 RepID=A0AAD4VNU9_PRUDU|nr:hypothetical protein L3X38_026712 [Prunus dulcis]
MRAPILRLPLKLYLAATNAAVGALLAQDDHGGEESPIYYVSRQLRGAEMRYLKTELLCLTLVYVAQRLRHYFLAHKLQFIVKSDPIRYLLTGSVLSERLTRCCRKTYNSFKQIVLEHIPGITNRYANALATLGLKLSFIKEHPNITVRKKYMPIVEAMVQEVLLEENDWRKPVKEKLREWGNIKDLKALKKSYAIIFGELYRRLLGGILTRCIAMAKGIVSPRTMAKAKRNTRSCMQS